MWGVYVYKYTKHQSYQSSSLVSPMSTFTRNVLLMTFMDNVHLGKNTLLMEKPGPH